MTFATLNPVGIDGAELSAVDSSFVKLVACDNAVITGNRVRGTPLSANPAKYRNTTTPPSANYKVTTASYVVGTTDTSYNSGPMARCVSGVFTAYLARWRLGTGIQLYKIVNGTATQLGSTVAQSQSVGSTISLTLQCDGSTISVYRNSETTPVISVTDTSITEAGFAGLWIAASATDGPHIVSWSADTLGSGSTDATADGVTLTGTATFTPGTATGGSGAVDATAEGVTLTGTATLTPGMATGGASGSFTSSPMYSSGILQTSVALDWTWYPGAIGVAPTAALVHGSGATATDGTLTAAGISAGSGFLLAETADGSIYYEAGTVA